TGARWSGRRQRKRRCVRRRGGGPRGRWRGLRQLRRRVAAGRGIVPNRHAAFPNGTRRAGGGASRGWRGRRQIVVTSELSRILRASGERGRVSATTSLLRYCGYVTGSLCFDRRLAGAGA